MRLIRNGGGLVAVVNKGRPPQRIEGRECRWSLPALLLACLVSAVPAKAQLPFIDIITAGVKKVIRAADLQVQRLQTETIGLQNAQKELENSMQASELADIAGWVERQRDLFAGYYQELSNVKNLLMTYEAVKGMIERQAQIVAGYKQVYAAVGQDKHFSPAELSHLYAVLSGILTESVENLNRLGLVIRSLVTRMSDAARLRIIDDTGNSVSKNYADLQEFSQQCFLLSLQRSKSLGDIGVTKVLYGIE